MNPLYQKLLDFPLDASDTARPFSARLAQEQGWTREYTHRVLVEYKRFLYLTQVSAGAVTPSKAVDEAWHLHLCYTRSYWDDLCRDTLGRPLHHDPSDGSTVHTKKHADQFLETLGLYRMTFCTEPPADIWLTAPVNSLTPVRAARPNRLKTCLPWAAAALLLIGAGCAAEQGQEPKGMAALITVLAIVGIPVIAVVVFLVWINGRTPNRNRHGHSGGSGCGSDIVIIDGGDGGNHCGSGHHGDGGASCASSDGGGSSCGGSSCGGGGCGGGGD